MITRFGVHSWHQHSTLCPTNRTNATNENKILQSAEKAHTHTHTTKNLPAMIPPTAPSAQCDTSALDWETTNRLCCTGFAGAVPSPCIRRSTPTWPLASRAPPEYIAQSINLRVNLDIKVMLILINCPLAMPSKKRKSQKRQQKQYVIPQARALQKIMVPDGSAGCRATCRVGSSEPPER